MGDVIVLSVLSAVVAAVIVSMLKNRRNGNRCSCGCTSCEKRFLCHPEEKEKR